MFQLICRNQDERTELIEYLKQNNINAVFHYSCLHDSPYYHDKHVGKEKPNAKRYDKCLVRLPLWVNMTDNQVNYVIQKVLECYKN